METLLEMWKQSIQLDGLYTFDEAPAACPPGYRVPTFTEWAWLIDNTEYSFEEEKKEGVFRFADGFELRLPAAGYRTIDGSLDTQGSTGYYWSSSMSGTGGRHVFFTSGTVDAYNDNRTHGFSVRCVLVKIDSLKPNNKINMKTNSIQTQGIEEMTREELIELATSLTKELKETKERLIQTEAWWNAAIVDRELLKKKIAATKAFAEVL